MLRLITMLSSLLVPAAAYAAEPAMQIGERDGVRFEYATELTPKGLVHISGQMLSSRQRFDLLVDAAGRVRGDFGGSYVEYDVPAAKHDAIVASLMTPSTSVATANALQSIAP